MSPDRSPILTVYQVRRAAAGRTPLAVHTEITPDRAVWNGFIYVDQANETDRKILGVSVTAWGADSTFEQSRRIEAVVAFYKKGLTSPRLVTYGVAEASDHLSVTVRRFQGTRVRKEFDERVWLELDLKKDRESAIEPVTTADIDMERSPHLHADLVHDVEFIARLTRGLMSSAGTI